MVISRTQRLIIENSRFGKFGKMPDDLPPEPRSFGNVQPPTNTRMVGADPWGQAKAVAEVYSVADRHNNGRLAIARFTNVGEALELFETGCAYVSKGTMKGVALISPLGEVIDELGEWNDGAESETQSDTP